MKKKFFKSLGMFLRSENLSNSLLGRGTDYLSSLLFICFVSICCYCTRDFIGYQSVGFIFLLVVLFISLFSPLVTVMFSALISALIWDYFFILPYGTFLISRVEDLMMCSTYFIAALITGVLTSRIRYQKENLVEKERRTSLLYDISKSLAKYNNLNTALLEVLNNLENIFPGDFFIIPAFNNELQFSNAIGLNIELAGEQSQLDSNELALIKWVYEKNKMAGFSTAVLPDSEGLYIPLGTAQSVSGVLGFIAKDLAVELSFEQMEILSLISHELALVLERSFTEKKLKETENFEMRDKLYQTVFSSISHELKTPLTTILGVASNLVNLPTDTKESLKQELMEELLSSAYHLNNVVDNLLDMSKIQSGQLFLKPDYCDVRDIFNSLLDKNKRILENFDLHVKYLTDSFFIFVDPKFFEQALTNILHNATRYAPLGSKIELLLREENSRILISISDEGDGIPETEREKVFEKFYRMPMTKVSGTGLGLYISKQIFDLHNAKVEIHDAENAKGTKFVISLDAVK